MTDTAARPVETTTARPVETNRNTRFGLEVLSPVAEPDRRSFPPARRLENLSGKTIGLAWNRKPGGGVARERVAHFLEERVNDVRILRFDDDIPFGPSTIEQIVDQCDAVIGTTADCGACSSWLSHDMIEIEKAGVPTVMITARDFIDDASLSMAAYGMPDLPTAVFDGIELTSSSDQVIFGLIDPILDEIVKRLTSMPESAMVASHHPAAIAGWSESETFTAGDSYAAWQLFNDEFLNRGWGDGFPLLPPTPVAVQRMLTGTSRDPKEIVVLMQPSFGMATVEKLAIACVMAGCEPGHLPVIIAAVEAMDDPKYWLRNVAVSTSPHAPMIVLNGPLAPQLGVNSKRCALGPGKPSKVNTAIGRALRLVMMNIGHAYPGTLDMDTIGSANKYSMCLAENEEDSPWEPLHVERGFQRTDSVVTMFSVESQFEIYDLKNHEPEAILNGYAGTVNSLGATHTRQWMYPRRHQDGCLLISPTHAKAIAAAGWSRTDVRRYVYDHAKVTQKMLRPILDDDRLMPSMRWVLDAPPETLLPVAGAYDWFQVVVVGGPVGKSSFTSGHGQSVSRLVETPQ